MPKIPANMSRLAISPCKKNAGFDPYKFFCFLEKPPGPLEVLGVTLMLIVHKCPRGI